MSQIANIFVSLKLLKHERSHVCAGMVQTAKEIQDILFIDNFWLDAVWIIAAVAGNASLTPIN